MNIDPRTVVVAIPSHSHRPEGDLAGSIFMNRRHFAGLTIPGGCSHVTLVRDIIAHQFLRSNFQWLICIDDDIVPSNRDWELLMEPTNDEHLEHGHPQPTRIDTAMINGYDKNKNPIEKRAPADILVCSEYAFKEDSGRAIKLGMGFVRIHRCVFEMLDQLKHPPYVRGQAMNELANLIDEYKSDGYDASKMEAALEKVEDELKHLQACDEPRLWQMMHNGELITDYYPSGGMINALVPTAEWKGEDHGFFVLCFLANITPRIETRTRLLHVGRKAYPYDPDKLGGAQ